MIRGIFFDATDVFYARRESATTFALNLLKSLGLRADVSEEDRARLQSLREQATEGRIGYAEYWDTFLRLRNVTDASQRKTMVKQIVEHVHQVVAIPGGREAMRGLKQRGFVLGIVTDTMYPVEWKMAWLARARVAEFVDVVACSTVLGAHKPNPEIYLHALRQARLQPSEAAFVGHDAGELAGARQAGMKTVAVNYDPEAKADYYCKSLVDLLNVPIFQRLSLRA
jgi:putative hydrolase of the HAD superfamily